MNTTWMAVAGFALVAAGCLRTTDGGDDGDDMVDPNCPGDQLVTNGGFDADLTGSNWIKPAGSTGNWIEADPSAPSSPNSLRLRGGAAKMAQVVPVPAEWTGLTVRGSWSAENMVPQPSDVPTPIAYLSVAMENVDGTTVLRELGTVDFTDQSAATYRTFAVTGEWPFGGGPNRLALRLATPLDPAQFSIDDVTLTGTCE
jgi:hypothetical protein